ncbi:hypothetical protein LCGC14_1243580 [marine sediment metagenome]|uniref:Uncharacterized protein n=1 Tax=marine sediment metagenome TaxID=412755 RepID=A0A0F9L535_9ZZZZ
MRAYARAKQMLKDAKNKMDVPSSPMVDRVFEVEAEKMRLRNNAGRR